MAKIETISEWLDSARLGNYDVEIRMVSGKTYSGHVDFIEKGYFQLKEYRGTYISIDKIESFTRKT